MSTEPNRHGGRVTLPSRPRRNPDAAYKIVDEEALIALPGDKAAHHVLNSVGAFIWELLDGENDMDVICRRITAEFDVEEDEARADLEDFLRTLRDKGMLADGGQGASE
jgi:hypothetical protein